MVVVGRIRNHPWSWSRSYLTRRRDDVVCCEFEALYEELAEITNSRWAQFCAIEDAGEAADARLRPMALALAIAALVGVPLAVLGLSFAFGLVIAAIEGWPALTGFMYCASNISGLGEPLTHVSPESLVAEVLASALASLCSSRCSCLAVLVLGLVLVIVLFYVTSRSRLNPLPRLSRAHARSFSRARVRSCALSLSRSHALSFVCARTLALSLSRARVRSRSLSRARALAHSLSLSRVRLALSRAPSLTLSLSLSRALLALSRARLALARSLSRSRPSLALSLSHLCSSSTS